MATKGERGDVPAPWGAWLAFGVAMVCSGGLPAVVWAGRCCCGEGRPWPLRGRCGALEVSHGPCNGHPTRRGPGKGRLWVGGGMGPCVGHVNAAMPTRSGPHGSRGDRHLKAEQRTIFDAVARGFLFSRGRKKQKQNKGARGWALRHSHARHTAPYHPQPTDGLCQGPCGSGGHCRAVGYPEGTTTAQKRR